MVASRSTNQSSALDWLNTIQRGGTEDWKRLYAACRDRAIAEAVATTLAWHDPDLVADARLWKFLLEDLHPGIRVSFRE